MTTTLLAVDDSKTMRKVLEITFSGEDYRTVLAVNSADALAKLGSEKPVVALVDARLGEENGYALCQSLKSAAPALPVLILSSKQQPYDRARGSAAGADDYMDKPFDTQQMLDKVAALVRKAAEAPAPAARPAAQPAPAQSAPAQVQAAARPVGQPARAQTLSYGTPVPGPAAQPAARPAMRPVAPAAQPARQPAPPAPAPQPARQPAPAAPAPQPAPVAPAAAVAVAVPGQLKDKLAGLGLTADQIAGVLALSREVVEQVVWEVVPVLAETLIEEEIKRLTSE